MRLAAIALPLVCGLFGQGIASRDVRPSARARPSGRPYSKFVNVSREAGLTTPIRYGGVDRAAYLMETSSGGVAFTDLNGDNLPDLFVTGGPETGNLLYLNRGRLPFENVSAGSGVSHPGWATAVAAGDYDGDGDVDLIVTYFDKVVLLANRGGASFAEVSGAGLPAEKLWYSGASFFDYDRDGDLDLFLATYAGLDRATVPKPGENANCNWKGMAVACGPRGLPTGRRFLLRNDGGRFTDVSARSGVDHKAACYGMTALTLDADADGWPDVYLACDSTPSLLFLNNRDGTFREEGIERGLALSDDGREQAGMGIAIGDIDGDGFPDLLKTHFADDVHGLYRNNGKGEFTDVAVRAGLGVETRMVGWGAGIEDFDNDGWPDLFIATGHVYPDSKLAAYPYRTPPLLFRNLGAGARFEQLPIGSPASSRGAAFADYDNDGDVDIALWNRNEAPTLLRNDSPPGNSWIRIAAPAGSCVTVAAGAHKQTRCSQSQASFYSVNDARLHFGLGAHKGTVAVRLGGRDWPALSVNAEHRLAPR